MFFKKKLNEKGVALILTIVIIAILTATSLELNKKVRNSVIYSSSCRDRITVMNMASSGVNAAMAMLVKDRKENEIDSLQEDWANPSKIKELLSEIGFENGGLEVEITDELSKIQVNSLVNFPKGRHFNEPQRVLWDRLLMILTKNLDNYDYIGENSSPNAIINSVKDWLDKNDDDAISGLSGAESDYYQDLEPPYFARNGPIPHLGELVMIKGITTQLFNNIDKESGLSDYMTVYGAERKGDKGFTYEGKININTAPLPVIAALLPEISQELAISIFNYRIEQIGNKHINNLSNLTWYKNAFGCSDLNINPKLITTKSDLFQIRSTAKLYDNTLTVVAVIKREQNKKSKKWYCKVISWYTE